MNRTRPDTLEPRTLTTKELDERIVELAAELFAPHLADAAADDCAPVPIRAAELVERMRPFLVYN